MPRARKPKVGRPSLGDDARTIPVVVKLSVRERDAIAAAVAKENAELIRDGADGDDAVPTTVSSWMRDHALEPLGLEPRSSAD